MKASSSWSRSWRGILSMLSLAFSSALMVSVTVGAILSISSVTNVHSASSNQHDPQPQQSHRRLFASARGRHGERANLVKPKTTTTRRRAVAGNSDAETVVAKTSSNNINKVIATDLPLNNSEFLKAMDQDHLPMFELSGYTVLGTSSFPKPSAMAERIPLNESISTASLIVPNLKPVHGAHRATADAVFLFAAEYPLSSYILFIGSLRQTGYDGDIVIAISKLDWNEKEVRDYLSHDPHVIVYAIHFSCFNAEWEPVTSVKGGMRVCQCHHLYGLQQLVEGDTSSIKQRKTIVVPLPDPREPRTIATTRYELYWIWVQAYNPSVWMLLIDARDSWFQTNPFDDLPRQVEGKGRKTVTSGQLYLFGENIEATRIGKSEKNRKWLENAYGDKVVSAVEHKPTICSGSTMGERMAIETYLRAMVAESDETGTKLMGADQGFHNFLHYSGKLQMATSISKVVVFDQGRGRINNLGAMRTKPLEAWGNGHIVKQFSGDRLEVYNWDGTLSPVVHQFDRHKLLSDYIYDTLTSRYQKEWRAQKHEKMAATSTS